MHTKNTRESDFSTLEPGDRVICVSFKKEDPPIIQTICDPPLDDFGNYRTFWRTRKGNGVYSAHPRRSLRKYHDNNNEKIKIQWKEM